MDHKDHKDVLKCIGLVNELAKADSKDAVWQMHAAAALSSASQVEVGLIASAEDQTSQLKLLNALIDKDLGERRAAEARRQEEQDRMYKVLEGILQAQVRIGKGQARLQEGVDNLQSVMSVTVNLQLSKYKYTASKASDSRHGDNFKAELIRVYEDKVFVREDAGVLPGKQPHLVRCMLLNVDLPKTLVKGAHIFKHEWSDDIFLLLGLDINDVRNGILLFGPLERAFDDSRICFSYHGETEDGKPIFKLELLDPRLANCRVWDYGVQYKLNKGYEPEQLGAACGLLESITFGELQGTVLTSVTGVYPAKRCLGFHAKQAIGRATAEGWRPRGWKPASGTATYTSDMVNARVQSWLATSKDTAPPPDSETSQSVTEDNDV